MVKRRQIDKDILYRVQAVAGIGNYKIDKLILGGVVADTYNLTIKRNNTTSEMTYWCDCMGFRRQNYPKVEHKHVKIVLAFIEAASIENPVSGSYYYKLIGKENKVKREMDRWGINDE